MAKARNNPRRGGYRDTITPDGTKIKRPAEGAFKNNIRQDVKEKIRDDSWPTEVKTHK